LLCGSIDGVGKFSHSILPLALQSLVPDDVACTV
jgi:hypothetical protein